MMRAMDLFLGSVLFSTSCLKHMNYKFGLASSQGVHAAFICQQNFITSNQRVEGEKHLINDGAASSKRNMLLC